MMSVAGMPAPLGIRGWSRPREMESSAKMRRMRPSGLLMLICSGSWGPASRVFAFTLCKVRPDGKGLMGGIPLVSVSGRTPPGGPGWWGRPPIIVKLCGKLVMLTGIMTVFEMAFGLRLILFMVA